MKDQNPVLTNKHTDGDYFNYLLESNINLSVLLKTADQLERELNAFTTAIQEAAWNSTPVIKTKLKGLNFPKEIRNLIAEKRKLRRKWHQSRNPHDSNLLMSVSQQLSKEIKSIINKFLTEITVDSRTKYSIWKATKYLKRPRPQVPPIENRWKMGP
jgi:Ribonuclease G/E